MLLITGIEKLSLVYGDRALGWYESEKLRGRKKRMLAREEMSREVKAMNASCKGRTKDRKGTEYPLHC
jgi:hypothetical protein